MKKKLIYKFHPSKSKSKKALVAIHGWKGNRNSMAALIKSININDLDWYLLEAPYPIPDMDNCFSWSYEKSANNWEEEEPRLLLQVFFRDIFKKYSSKDIYVLGFSQGGLICLDFALFLDQPLGGFFSIAGFTRRPKAIIQRCHPCQLNTPIIISHGIEDDIVPVSASKRIYKQLKDQGANVELILYKGKHKIGIECLRKIKNIIQS